MSHDHLEGAVKNSHSKAHLEGAIKSLLALEMDHCLPGSHHYGCPHCMTKHLLITEQLLEEENQQRPDNGFSDLIRRIKDLRNLKLPRLYDGEYVKGPEMEEFSKEARGIRLEVMQRAGLPMHETKAHAHIPSQHTVEVVNKHVRHEIIG